MRYLCSFFTVLLVLPLTISCSQADVARIMNDYLWEKRVLLLFAPHNNHAELRKLHTAIMDQRDAITDRDLVVWMVIDQDRVIVEGELKPQLSTSPFYDYFDVSSDDATAILLGKDGDEKLRQPLPLSLGALFTLIDAMPMRRREMLETN